jgi:poly-beta-1,6-N-acetyl-D-glucosamine synthase
MQTAAEFMVYFVAVYPIATAAIWVAGGVLFRLFDERQTGTLPEGRWPGVTVLIPAYNEEAVIATTVTAALAVDYPDLEVLVLDDGSHDETAAAAERAAAGDPRCQVIRDPVNRGKADRLNDGFRRARHDLVVVTDADTHMHPQAIRFLVLRLFRSPLVAAVAGAPHVTNRGDLKPAMQVLEAAAIIGLIRRTQALAGRVGVVAGVLGMFRKECVLTVGGYQARMATEDIDLSWRLLLAGWHTAFEPRALVGMQVPASVRALWAQRTRWARGQGEVLHVHLGEVVRWRNRRMWVLSIESLASLIWVVLLGPTVAIAAVALVLGRFGGALGFGLGWGIAIAVIATIQLAVAAALEHSYEPGVLRAFLLGPIYPLLFWIISAAAALHSQARALWSGPREQRVVWDIPREGVPPTA